MSGGEADRRVGDYVLERELGTGGMATVHLGRHTGTGARHAIKILTSLDPELVARFRREAEAIAAIGDHPHLVRVHAFGQESGRLWMALDYAAGGDLQRRLETDGPLEPSEACALVGDVARGLEHAHARGVLHRDIKPANVLFDEQGRARLTDFGLAYVATQERLTRTGEMLGTPVCMAPEQVQGDAVDARTDVYGLGALLYHALTGRPPFEPDAPFRVIRRVLQEAPEPPSKVRPELSPALDRICLRALAKLPRDRHADVAAFLAELEAPAGRGLPLAVHVAASILVPIPLLLILTGVWEPRFGPEPAPTVAAPPAEATPTPTPTPAVESPASIRARIDRLDPKPALAAIETVPFDRFSAPERRAWAVAWAQRIEPDVRSLSARESAGPVVLSRVLTVLGIVARLDPSHPIRGEARERIAEQVLTPWHQKLNIARVLTVAEVYADDPMMLDLAAMAYDSLGRRLGYRRKLVAVRFSKITEAAVKVARTPERRRLLLRQRCKQLYDAQDYTGCARAAAEALTSWDGTEANRGHLLLYRVRALWKAHQEGAAVDLTAAIADTERGQAAAPRLTLHLFYRALFLRKLKRNEAAIRTMESFCRLTQPTSAREHVQNAYGLAVAQLWSWSRAIGAPERAVFGIERLLAERAGEPQPASSSGWRVRLAWIALRGGRPEEAATQLRRAEALMARERDRLTACRVATGKARGMVEAGDPSAKAALRRLLSLLKVRWPAGTADPIKRD